MKVQGVYRTKKEDGFGISSKIFLGESGYIFGDMELYLCGNKICHEENKIFLLENSLFSIKEFISNYDKGEYKFHYTSKKLKQFSSISEGFSFLYGRFSNNIFNINNENHSEKKIFDEISKAYINFDWEPLSGYLLHFIEYQQHEYIFWCKQDGEEILNFECCKLNHGKFRSIFSDYVCWSDKIISKLR